jgi:hypothetical protein
MTEPKDSERHVALLMDFSENLDISDEGEEALEAAQDAITFTQSLWDLFRDQALHDDGDNPDYSKMENIVDAINGELAAAVLLLTSLNIDAEGILNNNAEALEKIRGETVNAPDNVPQVVIEGNRRLAKRIKNTRVIYNAKRITKLMPKQESS